MLPAPFAPGPAPGPEMQAFMAELSAALGATPFYSRLADSTHVGQETEQALARTLTAHFRERGPDFWHCNTKRLDPLRRDRADFYADVMLDGHPYAVVIEADPTRGDAIAKKFVSRVACLPTRPLLYVTLCYEGTKKMNVPESKKYLAYCAQLAARLSTENQPVLYLSFLPAGAASSSAPATC